MKQKRTPCIEGDVADTPKYVRKKCMYFVIFPCYKWFYHTLLSLVITFITVL